MVAAMNRTWLKPAVATALVALSLAACTTVIGPQPGSYPPASQQLSDVAPAASGTIYQPTRGGSLFSDLKARMVGDTVTIKLAERTQASKSASSDATKDSKMDTGLPILFGSDITLNGKQILNDEWETAQEFAGKGSSSQSNKLDGSITVTVAEVYPNGNLLVRGEKWLTLNQGQEFVQITGIIRPVDIEPNNTIPSFKVADARITYSGSGFVADSNRPGLLARIFMKFWPL
jgi:flagellar L-ring protein FlgH